MRSYPRKILCLIYLSAWIGWRRVSPWILHILLKILPLVRQLLHLQLCGIWDATELFRWADTTARHRSANHGRTGQTDRIDRSDRCLGGRCGQTGPLDWSDRCHGAGLGVYSRTCANSKFGCSWPKQMNWRVSCRRIPPNLTANLVLHPLCHRMFGMT